MPNAIDHSVHVMNLETKAMNVSDDEEDAQTPRMLNSPKRQTLVFGDDNANVGATLCANFDSLRTRA
jgi:hypothetical protein